MERSGARPGPHPQDGGGSVCRPYKGKVEPLEKRYSYEAVRASAAFLPLPEGMGG